MARFLSDSDYPTLIKDEIKLLLDGRAPDGSGTPTKLLAAEKMAEKQIRNWLSDRYDCDAIFGAAKTPTDLRDQSIVMYMIDLTLYHLYSQTGHKDVPVHRDKRYTDALDWLKNAGRGQVGADLPGYTGDEGDKMPDMRISSDTPEDNKW